MPHTSAPHTFHRLRAFIRLGRFHFLAGGFVLHGLGVAAALYHGAALNIPALLWGQIAITAIQLMTHYANDYFDLAADRANPTPTQWSGGSRVLPQGGLPPGVALITALVLALVVIIAALVLALEIRPGFFTPSVLMFCLLLAWSYSAPPLQLNSRGLGELSTALLVPGLTPLVGFYLQTGSLTLLPVLTVAPLCCLQFAMLLAIEFPDEAGDSAAGKRTLVVRLGPARAARLWIAALLAAYVLLPLLVLMGLPLPVAIAAGLSLPLALWQVWRISRRAWANPAQWNSLALWSIVLLMGTAAAEFVAFLELLGGIFS
jgi:1,4-dihydroxy-2-naphthoate octaprenyltransferase